ncbi:hypothetical protein L841_4782 [Mycobacterium sp. MAC_080597_8934]|nr:hypothetical protein L840_2635 [Mycobacterium sp. MAC_011194_8550]ETZ59375.1 hypothetical protein L841_4782 [Mycobacterium sp. MAC_080597_8934]
MTGTDDTGNEQGRPFTGTLSSTRATNWMFYDDKPVEVRYAPRNPRRNTLTSI